MMRLLLSLLLLLSFLQMNAQTYPKVILPGDYPDPSIMGSPDKPGGLSIQLCKSEKKEFYIRYSS